MSEFTKNHSQGNFYQLLSHHGSSAKFFFSLLKQKFFATTGTILMLGLGLSLPIFLITLAESSERFFSGNNEQAKIIAIIDTETTPEEQNIIIKHLQNNQEVEDITVISKKQALLEFQKYMGLSGLSQSLKENPLPAVIEIYPINKSVNQTENLAKQISSMANITEVKTDSAWLYQLKSVLGTFKKIVYITLITLIILMFLIIAREAQVLISHFRDEIYIQKMIGASHSYAVRPFLYIGFWYGLFAALIGTLIACLAIFWLSNNLGLLSVHLDLPITINYPSATTLLIILGFSIIIGVLSAWLGSRKEHTIIER